MRRGSYSSLLKRSTLVQALIAGVWCVIVGRLIWLQIIAHPRFLQAAIAQQNVIIEIQPRRGAIYDRDGRVLAEDVDAYSYYVVPERIIDKKRAAANLQKILGGTDWLEKLERFDGFLWVARKISPSCQAALESSGIETLGRLVERARTYPAGDLARAVLGRVNIDNVGLSGLELYYDSLLSGRPGKALMRRDGFGQRYQLDPEPIESPIAGADLVLTLDADLQHIAEQELAWGLTEFGGRAAMAIFEQIHTGEILACVSLDSLGRPTSRNCPITDQFEPGSTFKLMAVGQTLAQGRFTPSTVFDVGNGKLVVQNKIIRDDHSHACLTVEDIVVQSSNIGAAKLGLALGDEIMYRAIRNAGFTMPLGVDFPGEASGRIQKLKWPDHYLACVSFGHGIAVTPLQMVAFYAAIAADGDLYRPFFAKEKITSDGRREMLNHPRKIRTIFDPTISETLRRFLRQVVVRGTAQRADSCLIPIGGKTGTALKLRPDKKGYQPGKAVASFVGYFPAEAPQVAGIVVFDEPKTSSYGGQTAAPVFRRIVERYGLLPKKMTDWAAASSEVVPQQVKELSPQVHALVVNAVTESGDAEICVLPDFRGLTMRQALHLARRLGVTCEFVGTGIVAEQAPPAGDPCVPGTVIKLRCKSG